MFTAMKEQNTQAQTKHCEEMLLILYKPVGQKFAKGGYAIIGGTKEYREDMKRVEEDYLALEDLYVMVSAFCDL